jgi:hypothetical protein
VYHPPLTPGYDTDCCGGLLLWLPPLALLLPVLPPFSLPGSSPGGGGEREEDMKASIVPLSSDVKRRQMMISNDRNVR